MATHSSSLAWKILMDRGANLYFYLFFKFSLCFNTFPIPPNQPVQATELCMCPRTVMSQHPSTLTGHFRNEIEKEWLYILCMGGKIFGLPPHCSLH